MIKIIKYKNKQQIQEDLLKFFPPWCDANLMDNVAPHFVVYFNNKKISTNRRRLEIILNQYCILEIKDDSTLLCSVVHEEHAYILQEILIDKMMKKVQT